MQTSIQPLLSSFLDYVYVHKERNFASVLSSVNIKDVVISDENILILTNNVSLSSVLTNEYVLSSVELGFDGASFFNAYDPDNNNVSLSGSHKVYNNNIVTIAYKEDDTFNIIPLKSTEAINYEHNLNTYNNRNYDGLYLENNSRNEYQNVYAQYKANRYPIRLNADEYTNVYLPAGIANTTITNMGFVENGANYGKVPCNSDVIFFDRFGYTDYTNHGATNNTSRTFNGMPLCLWLSANDAETSTRWMERWYDPNQVSQGAAFLALVNTTSAIDPVIDRPSNLVFIPKSKFTYLKFGETRNTTFVNSFSSNLIFHMEEWSNQLEDSINGIKGFTTDDYSNEVFNYADMNGSFHFHIPPTDELLQKNNISFGMWVYQSNWSCGIDTQYFGNFSNGEGYGLIFNTSANPELITFPTVSGFVYGFNNRGIRVFEKSINNSLGVSASKIDYIVTDLFGARWIYDSINKNIYKLDTDDLLKKVIKLPHNAVISKLQINSQNELYAMNTHNKTISGFDSNGNLNDGPYGTSNYNTFELSTSDNIHLDFADIIVLDAKNRNYIKAIGINLYKNNVLFYHIGHKIQAMNIDSDNNLWVISNGKDVLKLDMEGNVLLRTSIVLPFEQETSIEFNFVKENKGSCNEDILWIVFNTNNYVVKMTSSGKIIKRINVKDVVNLKACRDFNLNVRGDFTGFDARRKYYNFSDGSLISSTNPAITLKLNVNCGENKRIIQLHAPSTGMTGWNHLSFTFKNTGNYTYITLYINGEEVAQQILTGIYSIDYGTKVSPFIIGGHSGKLGAKNVERSLNNEGYFIGRVDDARLYNRVLEEYELRGLAMNLYYMGWEPYMTWYMPIPEISYMEEIQEFHTHRYHGSKSNKYNIRIKNLDITNEDVQGLIKATIESSIKKISPLNTELNEIIFE